MSKYLLNKTWSKLTTARAINENIRLMDGQRLTDTEFAVLCLIAHHPNTTTAKIVNHPYFDDISLSTIKRSVQRLTKEKLINTAIPNDGDKRERLLNVVEVEQ